MIPCISLFLSQLLIEAGLEHMLSKLEEHFHSVLKCASRLQSETHIQELDTPLTLTFSVEKFGEELLKCIETLPPSQVVLGVFYLKIM